MYSRILLATDGSDLSLAACEHGLRLAKSLGVGALAVYASPPFDVPTGFEFVPAPLLPVDVYVESTRAAAKKNLGAVTALAKKLGVDCDTRHLRSLPPAEAIVAAAEDRPLRPDRARLARPRRLRPDVAGLGHHARAGDLRDSGAGASRGQAGAQAQDTPLVASNLAPCRSGFSRDQAYRAQSALLQGRLCRSALCAR